MTRGWKTEEPFETDTESGSANGRLQFDFTGSTQHPLSLDPSEFKGVPLPKITEEIKNLMRSIAPGVDFAGSDLELAAEAVAEANGDPT